MGDMCKGYVNSRVYFSGKFENIVKFDIVKSYESRIGYWILNAAKF